MKILLNFRIMKGKSSFTLILSFDEFVMERDLSQEAPVPGLTSCLTHKTQIQERQTGIEKK